MESERQNKKVSFFMRRLTIGGLQRVTVTLANEFAALGYTVDLVVVLESGPLQANVSSAVNVRNLSQPHVTSGAFEIVRYLQRSNSDVVVSGSDSVNQLLALCKGAGLLRSRLVIAAHTQMSKLMEKETVWYSRFIPWMLHVTYPMADEVLAVSEGIASDLKSMSDRLADKVKVVHNPVVDASMTKKSEQDVSHEWINDPDVPVILGVGRLSTQKNFPLLIRAFRRIQPETGAKLLILGDGSEKKKLRTLISRYELEDHVDLAGFVTNPYAYFSKASLFVLSSDYEGLPTVLIEALACGCPVVSTDCPSGPREILEDGRWGPLVPVGDPEALADAMVRTLNNPPERHRLQERAKAFNVANAITKYQEILFPDNYVEA